MAYNNLSEEGGVTTPRTTPREEGQYFEDGRRLIDFVLVYKEGRVSIEIVMVSSINYLDLRPYVTTF